MRIVVVEDEKKIATFIQKGLKERGFVADIVHRGDAALEIIEANHFDVVCGCPRIRTQKAICRFQYALPRLVGGRRSIGSP